MDETARYRSDAYLEDHPRFHDEDASWKSEVLTPLLDEFAIRTNSDQLTALDVGGGGGTVFLLCMQHLIRRHGKSVRKILFDLSPGMLNRQASVHGTNAWPILGDVRHIPLPDKAVDVVFLIDVLEHVPQPTLALDEVRRVSHSAVLKVPLERNLYFWGKDFASRGAFRRMLRNRYGHINRYNYRTLKRQIESHLGRVVAMRTANVFAYFAGPAQPKDWTRTDRATNDVARMMHRLSPRASAAMFMDFALLLVECH